MPELKTRCASVTFGCRRIEQGANTAADALSGDAAPVYLGVLRRIVPGELPASPEAAPQGGSGPDVHRLCADMWLAGQRSRAVARDT